MSGVTLWALVAVAGGAGAVCRYVVDFAVSVRASGLFPWGTLVVNVSGSFLFGVVAGLTSQLLPAEVELVLAVGFCGAYTTFSTHMVETVQLVEERRLGGVVLNIVCSLGAGVLAVACGLLVARVAGGGTG